MMPTITTYTEAYVLKHNGPVHYDVTFYFNGKGKVHVKDVGGKSKDEATRKAFEVLSTIHRWSNDNE